MFVKKNGQKVKIAIEKHLRLITYNLFMPNIVTSQPFPSDAWKPPKECSFIASTKSIKQVNSIYPIDEMEEFQDPFSDLSLFLCKKINEVMHKKGGIKNWNQQIEKDLLQRILPEFKIKFPYYRLGIAALKRTWEKITYYQKKVTCREAYQLDGKLNINYLIKENIRSYHQNYKQSGQYYYDQTPALANNLCECIAILEGKRPKLQHLTRTIWSVQQHLFSLSTLKTMAIQKKPDIIDRFLCQSMLYSIYKNPILSYAKLKILVRNNFFNLFQSDFFTTMENLATTLSIALSKSYLQRTRFNPSTKIAIDTCICNHIHRVYQDRNDSSTTHLSFVHNVISIFSLLPSLPKNYDIHRLRTAIRLIVQEKSRSFLSYFPNFDPTLYAFIKIESLLLQEKKKYCSKEQLEEEILCAYKELCSFPNALIDHQILEIEIWDCLDTSLHISQSIPKGIWESLLMALDSSIIDTPGLHFAEQVRVTTHTLQKIHQSIVEQREIEEKIEYFCLQNEMACRFIHIEKQYYLWELLQRSIVKGVHKKKKQVIKEVVKMSISLYPILSNYMQHLLFRIDTLYTHFWYCESCKKMNTLTAFIYRQSAYITTSLREKKKILQERITQLLPLTPFSDKEI